MPRGNGSYMGQAVSPNSNVASGIWTVREAETYLRADKWPAQPTVPSAPTGTPGDGQVELTWTAPTGGSTPTDYIVQYSSNGGSSWTTFSDGVSSATAATVTGLTNGTGYIFRVQAVNILGESPYGSASGTITPSAIDVSLLLHFDGTNGSTTIADSSPNALTATAYGGAALSTAQSKFGTASLELEGGKYVTVDPPSGFALGTDLWTVEGWVYMRSLAEYSCFLEIGNHGSDGILFALGSMRGAVVYSGGFYGSGATVPLNQWNHVAWSFDGSLLKMFLNGVEQWSAAFSLNLTGGGTISTGWPIGLSAYDPNNQSYIFDGYLDELRIVKGTAVYTENFTPPSAPF